MKTFKLLTLVMMIALGATVTTYAQTITTDVTIVELSQTPGAFETTALTLKPGKYQFKVTNASVAKDVGFVIQAASDKNGDVMKTAIPNSFGEALIAEGETTTTGIVELKAGEYVYSCPLNPTPKYTLTVK